MPLIDINNKEKYRALLLQKFQQNLLNCNSVYEWANLIQFYLKNIHTITDANQISFKKKVFQSLLNISRRLKINTNDAIELSHIYEMEAALFNNNAEKMVYAANQLSNIHSNLVGQNCAQTPKLYTKNKDELVTIKHLERMEDEELICEVKNTIGTTGGSYYLSKSYKNYKWLRFRIYNPQGGYMISYWNTNLITYENYYANAGPYYGGSLINIMFVHGSDTTLYIKSPSSVAPNDEGCSLRIYGVGHKEDPNNNFSSLKVDNYALTAGYASSSYFSNANSISNLTLLLKETEKDDGYYEYSFSSLYSGTYPTTNNILEKVKKVYFRNINTLKVTGPEYEISEINLLNNSLENIPYIVIPYVAPTHDLSTSQTVGAPYFLENENGDITEYWDKIVANKFLPLNEPLIRSKQQLHNLGVGVYAYTT